MRAVAQLVAYAVEIKAGLDLMRPAQPFKLRRGVDFQRLDSRRTSVERREVISLLRCGGENLRQDSLTPDIGAKASVRKHRFEQACADCVMIAHAERVIALAI